MRDLGTPVELTRYKNHTRIIRSEMNHNQYISIPHQLSQCIPMACPLLVMMSRHCKGRSSFTSFGVAGFHSPLFFLAISGDPKTNDVPTKNQNEPNVWDSLVGPTLQETPLVPFSSTMALSWQTQLLGDPDAKTIEGLQGHLGATAKHVGCDMGALSVCFFGLVEGTFKDKTHGMESLVLDG